MGFHRWIPGVARISAGKHTRRRAGDVVPAPYAGSMAQLPFNRAIATAVAELVDANSPISHDGLGRLFGASPLARFDPGNTEGKLKRSRAVFTAAVNRDTESGGKLAEELLAVLGTAGFFQDNSARFVGKDRLRQLQTAYGTAGWASRR